MVLVVPLVSTPATTPAPAATEIVQTGLGPRHVYSTKPGTFSRIPTISLDAPAATVASQIYAAAIEVGFFYITNHDIPSSLVTQTHEEMHRFFYDLSTEQKMVMSMSSKGPEEYCGYWPIRTYVPEGASGTRMVESIMWPYDPLLDGEEGEDENKDLWPKEEVLPGFRKKVGEYEKAILKLSRRLLKLFALALGQEEEYFDKIFEKPGTLMSFNHYPAAIPQTSESAGVHAHSDYECFTILSQDSVESLEVLSKDGAWVPAPPIPGTFLVNIGDTLRMMTNDIFMSTVHRAYNKTGKVRYSIPYFFGANYDATLDTVPSCINESEGRPKKYEPVKAGVYVKKQLALMYAD